MKKDPKALDAWIKAAGKASNLSEEIPFRIELIGYFCEAVVKQKTNNGLSGIAQFPQVPIFREYSPPFNRDDRTLGEHFF